MKGRAKVPLQDAIQKAERSYSRIETLIDRRSLLDEVQRMAKLGMTDRAIAEQIGHTERNVTRLRLGEVAEPPQPMWYRFDYSTHRAATLLTTAMTACELAHRLREDDPQLTYDALRRLTWQELLELTMVCLAGLPIDQTLTEIFGWVEWERTA